MKIAQRIGGFPIELILSRWGGWGGMVRRRCQQFHFMRNLSAPPSEDPWMKRWRFSSLCISISSDLIINVSNLFQRQKDSLWDVWEFRVNRLSQVIQNSTKLTSITTHYHSKESVQDLESTRAVISVVKKERIMILNPFSSISRILVSNFKLLSRKREVQWRRWKSHRKKYDRLPGVWHHESLEAIRLLHGRRVRRSDTHRNGETESVDWSISLLQSWISSQSGSAKDSHPDFLVLV